MSLLSQNSQGNQSSYQLHECQPILRDATASPLDPIINIVLIAVSSGLFFLSLQGGWMPVAGLLNKESGHGGQTLGQLFFFWLLPSVSASENDTFFWIFVSMMACILIPSSKGTSHQLEFPLNFDPSSIIRLLQICKSKSRDINRRE
jgi:hypothetical protein